MIGASTLASILTGMLLASGPARTGPDGEAPPWSRPARGNEVDLAPRGEPGGRFVIEGRVLANGKPLAGLTLYVYHADAKGLYAPKERPNAYPRLAGVLRTDTQGRYRVLSVLPGQYEGPPHVHFEAWGPDLPARGWFVNLSMAPGEKPDPAWGRMAPGGRMLLDPGRETFVTRDPRGVFHAHYALHWDRGFAMPAAFDSLRRGLGRNAAPRAR
jgi:hypothetical protein